MYRVVAPEKQEFRDRTRRPPSDLRLAPLKPRGRTAILIIAAHPDDETIGAGALLSRVRPARVVHVTDGSPPGLSDAISAGFSSREAYAAARRFEAANALSKAGIAPDAIETLHFTDQQVSFRLEELTLQLISLLERHEPELILTHAYEGGHPDHDAVAFAVQLAQRIHGLSLNRTCLPPRLFEFAGYHGKGGWMKTYEFLPCPGREEFLHALTGEERRLKGEMLRLYASQAKTLEPFLPPRIEVFRRAPKYDFTRPPHGGKLFYENFDWGIDGPSWRELASQALLRFSRRKGLA